MRRTGSIVAVLAMLLAAGTAIAQQTNTLETLRQGYEKKERSVLAQYGKTLDTLMADVKKKGDLDGVIALQAEKKRFETENTVQPLSDCKALYYPVAEAYYRTMVATLDQYIKSLDELTKQEVAADRIEEAKLVRAEKDKAAFMLADMQSRLPDKGKGGKETGNEGAAVPAARSPSRSDPLKSLRNSLVLYFSFDNEPGRNFADESGKGNDAVGHNASENDLVPVGKDNKALRLDMSYLQIPDAPSLRLARKGYTLALWCYPDQVGIADMYVLISKMAGWYKEEYGLDIAKDGKIRAFGEVGSLQPLKPKRWYHIAATLDPQAMDNPKQAPLKIYVNGREEKCNGRPQSLYKDGESAVQIGHVFSEAYAYYFKGFVDDVRIYNRPLTALQIKTLYNSPPAPEMRSSR